MPDSSPKHFMSIVNRANRQKTFTLNCLRIQCYRVARFSYFVVISTPPPIRERSIVMSVYVCQSVCLCVSAIISSELHVRVKTHARGSVLLWGRSDTLGISGYTDDVLLAHKMRLLDVAARLGQRGSHAALRLARRNTRCRQRTLETTPGPTRPQLTRQVAPKSTVHL